MLYIDQPIATGFSYGSNPIDSTDDAAWYILKFLQAFHSEFRQYQGREFSILGISYGGHTVPGLGSHILRQNAHIEDGIAQGTHINLTAMGLINAWVDAAIQTRENIEFAHGNSYRQLISGHLASALLQQYDDEVKPAIESCRQNFDHGICAVALEMLNFIDSNITKSAKDTYEDFTTLAKIDGPMPDDRAQLENLEAFLGNSTVQSRINANQTWRDEGGYDDFVASGDSKWASRRQS